MKFKSTNMVSPLPLSNPFINLVTLDAKQKAKIAFMSLFVAPMRLLLISVALGMAYVVSSIALMEIDFSPNAPLNKWQRKTRKIVSNLLVAAHFVAGFHHVKIKGKKAKPWQAPIIVAAPHASFFDTLPVCIIGAPSLVAKEELLRVPVIGKIISLIQPITVDRENRDSRKITMEKIIERAQLIQQHSREEENEWPQVLIFPEGTCTNQTQLLSFKLGAFSPQLPVQPVCFKWLDRNPDHISSTWEGAGVAFLLWLTLCSPKSGLEVEFLPVHVPNESERKDPALFAQNVRNRMSQCLRIPLSDYGYEDVAYLTRNIRPKIGPFWHLCKKLDLCDSQMQLEHVWNCVKDSRSSQMDFVVSEEDFACFLKVELRSHSVRRLFNVFDWKCQRLIDLREYLITRHGNVSDKNFFKTSYLMFCNSLCDLISEEDLTKIVRLPFQMSRNDIRKMIDQIIRNSRSLNYVSISAFLARKKLSLKLNEQ